MLSSDQTFLQEMKIDADLVNILFWHSMALTIVAPISRLICGQWEFESGMWIILNIFGLKKKITCSEESWSADIDPVFWLHASAGILWMVTAWVNIYLLQDNKALHRKFGAATILAFCLHTIAALRNLHFNIARNSLLPRLFLVGSLIDSTISIIIAMNRAKRRDIQGHRDAMVQGFIYSLEGAGTIRTVGYLQIAQGFGPTHCKDVVTAAYSGGTCIYSYFWRMVLTRFLSLFYLGVFLCRYCGPRKKEKMLKGCLELLFMVFTAIYCYDPVRLASIDNMIELYPCIAVPLFIVGAVCFRICVL